MSRLDESLRAAISRLPTPDLRPRVAERLGSTESRPIPRSLRDGDTSLRRMGVIAVALTAFAGGGAFAWSLTGLDGDHRTNPDPPAETSPGEVETPWFRAELPSGWHAVLADNRQIGQGTFALQVTSFATDDARCLTESGVDLPADGALLRLTIGWERAWEGSLVAPRLTPVLEPPPSHGPFPFVDDCGAGERRLAIFFGPDGHLMTAHALFGAQASPEDMSVADDILTSLQPTGGPPMSMPMIETVFASGTSPAFGPWAFTLRDEEYGGKTLAFRTDRSGWGIAVDETTPPLATSIGSIDDSRLLVMGVVPRAAAEIVVELETGQRLTGTMVPLPDGISDSVAFWVDPFEGELAVEGTRLTPGAVITVFDSKGTVLAMKRLP